MPARDERGRLNPTARHLWLALALILLVGVSGFVEEHRLVVQVRGQNHRILDNQRKLVTLNALIAERHRQIVLRDRKIAETDRELCVTVYGQLRQIEAQAVKTATPAFYHRLLPSLSYTEVRNLAAEARREALQVESRFDPAKCKTLPSQKVLLPSG